MEDNYIEILKQDYFELDKPVPYKNFFLYPVKVKDYYTFYKGIDSLTLEKNKDPNGIMQSHLGYLFSKMEQEPDKHYDVRFGFIAELCLGIKNGIFCNKCGEEMPTEEIVKKLNIFSEVKNKKAWEKLYSEEIQYCKKCKNLRRDIIAYGKDENNQPRISIKGEIITKEDFDKIRRIICYQNLPNFDDSYIDPELEEELKEKHRLQNGNVASPDLETQMCCIVAGSAYKFEELKEMTLRKFVLLLQKIDSKLHYQIYKTNENSGAVTFKGGLDHWIYPKKRTKFDDLLLLDNLTQKLDPISKK